MKLTLLLADAAQVDLSHKISALGIGWTKISSPTPPIAVIVIVEISGEEILARPTVYVRLTDEQGELAPTGDDGGTLMYRFVPDGEIDRSQVAIHPRVVIPFALQIGPGLNLAPGQYKFAAEVDGRGDVSAEQPFEVVAAAAQFE